jgi:hypothetical protein
MFLMFPEYMTSALDCCLRRVEKHPEGHELRAFRRMDAPHSADNTRKE